jgi:hypothetical protein
MDDLKLIHVDGRKHKAVSIRPHHRVLYAELQKPEHRGEMKSAMAAVGYPLTTQHKPKTVTETKSWRALLDENVSEDLLTMRHNELLNKREGKYVTYGRGKNRTTTFIDHGPDVTAVRAGLEMGYKLRGKFVSEPPPNPQPTNVYNLFYSPQVRASVTSFEDSLKHAIAHEIARTPDRDDTPSDRAEATDDRGTTTDAGSVA